MLLNDFKKFLKDYQSNPNEDSMDQAERVLDKMMSKHMRGRVLTFDEALEVIKMNKSPGWPYSRGFNGKKYKTKKTSH